MAKLEGGNAMKCSDMRTNSYSYMDYSADRGVLGGRKNATILWTSGLLLKLNIVDCKMSR